MTAWVLVLAGVAAGDGGTGTGAAMAPVASDLGGRWVGTYHAVGRKTQEAELDGGVLRVGPDRTPARCRFTGRRAAGTEGAVVLVPEIGLGPVPAAYRLDPGRLVICCGRTKALLADFAVTGAAGLIVLQPAARKP